MEWKSMAVVAKSEGRRSRGRPCKTYKGSLEKIVTQTKKSLKDVKWMAADYDLFCNMENMKMMYEVLHYFITY